MSLLYHTYSRSWAAAGAGESLEIVVPGSAFLDDVRAVRDGRPFGTLAGQFFAIPGLAAVPNRYFWATQADAGGTQRGFDPADTVAGLAGYTGTQVTLPTGTLDGDTVAAAFETAMAAVYTSVARVGDTIVITDTIDSVGAFTGTEWDARGQAGIWGMRFESDFTNNFPQNDTIFCHAVAPAIAGTRLRAIDIRIGSAYAEQLRLGVYEGGTAVDPTGAALLFDAGQLPAGLATDTWHRLWASSDIPVGNATNLWIGCVASGAGTTNVNYQTLASGRNGDFSATNLYNANLSIGQVPGNALPGTFPAGGVLTGFAFVLGLRLVYEATPVVSDGSWKRRFGVHVDAPDMTAISMFDAQILVGGNLPPQVEGMLVDYLEVAGTLATFRLGLAQGGIVEDPDGAAVIWDGGRAPSGVPVDWYRVTAPTGALSIPVDRTQDVWWWGRGDGGQGPIHFSFGLGGGQAGPDDNPMDWLPNLGVGTRPEYEAPAANINHSTNPDTPFESPFVADPVNDFYPQNVPGAAIGLRADGFTLTPV